MKAARKLVTPKAFARILDTSPSYITELKAAGRLVVTDDGKVDVDASQALIRETADPAKTGVRERHAAGRGKGQGAPTPPPAADCDDDSPSEFEPQSSDAKRRAKALADKAETDAKAADRDYRISIGALLDVADVEHAARTAAATLRNGLENLANTLAPEIAAEPDEGKVRVILADAIEHALDELSRQFAAIAKTEAV